MGVFLLVSFGLIAAILIYLVQTGKKQKKSGTAEASNIQMVKRTPPIPCPECGNAVSTSAAFCPHCGLLSGKAGSLQVTVTDFNMDFGSIVIFLVKIVIAAIPAILILFMLGLTFAAAFGLIGAISR